MKTLIIYDSYFGNTQQIAEVIGETLGLSTSVRQIHINEAKPEQLKGVDLLIVGSPTRGFMPTKPIVDFLNQIPAQGLVGIKVAAFDTRIGLSDISSAPLRFIMNLGGYAAKPLAKKLQKKGGVLVGDAEGFFVKDQKGPLKDGETNRAILWAYSLID